jgi:hypothetical protein
MTAAAPRPLVPALARIYPEATEWAYLLLRVVAGLMLIPHVWPKLMAGPSAVAANAMARSTASSDGRSDPERGAG